MITQTNKQTNRDKRQTSHREEFQIIYVDTQPLRKGGINSFTP